MSYTQNSGEYIYFIRKEKTTKTNCCVEYGEEINKKLVEKHRSLRKPCLAGRNIRKNYLINLFVCFLRCGVSVSASYIYFALASRAG